LELSGFAFFRTTRQEDGSAPNFGLFGRKHLIIQPALKNTAPGL